MFRIGTVALASAMLTAAAGANAQGTPGYGTPVPRQDSTRPDMRRGPDGPRGRRIEGPKDGRGMRGFGGPGMRGPGFGPGFAGGFRPGMEGPGMEFLRSLNLTAAQRDQIRSIHEKYRPQLEAVRNGTRSQIESARTARQRGDTAAARAALQSVRQSTEQQMVTIHEQMFREVRGVLTADQRAKVDSAINERIQRLDQQKALLQRLRQ